jgi:hypothetical protein
MSIAPEPILRGNGDKTGNCWCLFAGTFMKRACQIPIGLIVLASSLCNGNELKPEPNAILRLTFAELPKTLYAKATGNQTPAFLTAQLPENYGVGRKFPLFVFLNGGNDGSADLPIGREIVGGRDFICTGLPLFKRSFDTNEAGGLLISMDDFNTVSSA